jgi:TolB-like protein/DNA-binding winged helix-turn-helix (wHTH) protein/Flp pilus assembly protein TadD
MDPSPPTSFTINGIVADLGSETLHDRKGNALALRPQAFMVLRHLLLNSSRLVTKDELFQTVWPATAVTDDSLVQCIHEIRRALKDDAHAVLKTVSGRGYRLVLPTKAAISSPRRFPLAASVAGVLMIIAGAAVSGWMLRIPSTPIGKPVVAVLPFDNYGGDEATGRLADGLTEDIITDLARFPEFEVLARNSTETYKGNKAGAGEVGKALGVGFIVEGSIARDAKRVRITAQLIDAKTDNHLWSDRWDRPVGDFFAVQTEIAEQIANRLGGGGGVVQEAGRIAAHRKAPSNLNAYELYLLGTERLEQINRRDVEQAISLLKRAVELDPTLARAWVELYHSYNVMTDFGGDLEEYTKLAAEAAGHAVTVDPSDPEAHAVYAMSIGDKGDLERAKAEFETALRLAPNQFEILTFYTTWASTFGEPERGAEMVDEAVRLNPSYPMWSARLFASAYFFAGRYEDALRMVDRLGPDNYGIWMGSLHAGALAALGQTEEAKASVSETLKLFPHLTIQGWLSDPVWTDAERQRLSETMRLAGFPACAKAEELAKFEKPLGLPGCVSH